MKKGQTFEPWQIGSATLTVDADRETFYNYGEGRCFVFTVGTISTLDISVTDSWHYKCGDVFPYFDKEFTIIETQGKPPHMRVIGECYDNLHTV